MSEIGSKKFPILYLLLLLFITADSFYTLKQNYNLPLDGDLAPIVAPSEHYSQILNDPFGISIIKEGKHYAATSRYFSHITMVGYFRNFHSTISPFFNDKVKAIYFTAALFNTAVQLFIIFILSIYICGHAKFWKVKFLLAASLLLPFFQYNDFYDSIGIIDKSVTYTFFYALPISLLLLYFLPFYLSPYHKTSVKNHFKFYQWPIWVLLAIYISFSGSLIAPIVFIICPSIILANIYFKLKANKQALNLKNSISAFSKLSKTMIAFFILIIVLCVYSFYIGKFNIENGEPISLKLRYLKLLKGLPFYFTHKITFVLIGVILIANFVLIKKHVNNIFQNRNFKLLILVTVLCMVYVLLLPLGGYRPYRPIIIRYDTFLPVTIVILLLTCGTSYYIIVSNILRKRLKLYYILFITIMLVIFEISDVSKSDIAANECQKQALYSIRASEESVVKLDQNCNILSWFIISDPNYTNDIGTMLQNWGITDNEVRFYQVIE